MSFEDDLATLNINVNSDDAKPLYQQLAAQIRNLIHSQRLASGEQLPSSRKLALLLSISRTSALNVYNQLIAEGLLVTRPGAGIFVTTLGNSAADYPTVSITPSDCSDKKVAIEAIKNRGIFDAGPDVEQFPFAEWSRSLSRVWRRPDPALLREFHLGGYLPLRQAVTRYIKAVRDVECHPDQVIITAGNRDALALIAKAMLAVGDKVSLENPCYPPLRHGLTAQGADIRYSPVDIQGMAVPDEKVKLAWMTPARQYPLGVTMSTERRLDWLEYSRQHQCWLVEDDYDSEFQYHKTPLVPLFNLSTQLYPPQQQSVILVGSFSKLLFRTLRIGYLIVPRNLITSFQSAQEHLGSLASVPIQPALADFLAHRRFASHLRRMRRCYQQRRDFLHSALSNKLGDRLTSELPDCGMSLLARLTSHDPARDDIWLEQQLLKQGISAPALSKHYLSTDGVLEGNVSKDCASKNHETQGQQGLLLGFSGVSESNLELGVSHLERLLK
ncbi:MAG: PLP-dependent aminotransferase family protein [Motiliproteus sp.]